MEGGANRQHESRDRHADAHAGSWRRLRHRRRRSIGSTRSDNASDWDRGSDHDGKRYRAKNGPVHGRCRCWGNRKPEASGQHRELDGRRSRRVARRHRQSNRVSDGDVGRRDSESVWHWRRLAVQKSAGRSKGGSGGGRRHGMGRKTAWGSRGSRAPSGIRVERVGGRVS